MVKRSKTLSSNSQVLTNFIRKRSLIHRCIYLIFASSPTIDEILSNFHSKSFLGQSCRRMKQNESTDIGAERLEQKAWLQPFSPWRSFSYLWRSFRKLVWLSSTNSKLASQHSYSLDKYLSFAELIDIRSRSKRHLIKGIRRELTNFPNEVPSYLRYRSIFVCVICYVRYVPGIEQKSPCKLSQWKRKMGSYSISGPKNFRSKLPWDFMWRVIWGAEPK